MERTKTSTVIKASKVRVVTEEGSEVISLAEAEQRAEEEGLDIILIRDGETPVVKIGDLNKYLYEQKKVQKQREKFNRASAQGSKEIQINPETAEHDLKVKAKTVDRLLSENNRVKLSIKYRGRAMRQISEGADKLREFEGMVTVGHKVFKQPTINGNTVTMVIEPVKK